MTKESLVVSSVINVYSCLSAVMYTELCMCSSDYTYSTALCRDEAFQESELSKPGRNSRRWKCPEPAGTCWRDSFDR